MHIAVIIVRDSQLKILYVLKEQKASANMIEKYLIFCQLTLVTLHGYQTYFLHSCVSQCAPVLLTIYIDLGLILHSLEKWKN